MGDSWNEARDHLLNEEPGLAQLYAASQPAYIVAREVLATRAVLGISQAELARRMGTSQSVVSRIENMDGSPNLKTVLALAEALGRRVELRFVDPRDQSRRDTDGGAGPQSPTSREIVGIDHGDLRAAVRSMVFDILAEHGSLDAPKPRKPAAKPAARSR
jgi:transcriptional regulator with XRE-family HTH domain